MPILIGIAALFVPRVMIFGLWLLTDWFVGVFDSILWPILGFLFAPFTMLWYSAVMNLRGGTWDTLEIIVLVIAVIMDFSPASSRKRK